MGIFLWSFACSLDDRAVQLAGPGGVNDDVNDEMPGGATSSPASGAGGFGNTVSAPSEGGMPSSAEMPVGTDMPLEMDPAENDTAGSPDAGTPVTASPDDGTPPPEVTPDPVEQPQLRLTFGGDGFGSVTISATGFAQQICDDDCTVRLPAGTLATFSATPRIYSVFRAWSDASCESQLACSVVIDPNGTVRAAFQLGYNVAFVSSELYSVGELPAPGVDANQECARLAAAAGVHGSRWVAWLAAEGPTTAIEDDITPSQFLQNPGGWVRTDGAPLARNRSALLSSRLLHPLNLTERATAPANFASWSGTDVGGIVNRSNAGVAYDCNNWTDDTIPLRAGIAVTSSIADNWSGAGVQGCGALAALQCFGDDPAPEVPLPSLPAGARLAFASTARFDPGDGIESADNICQEEACAADLSGSNDCAINLGTRSFRAYLHTSQAPAWERFDLARPNWHRVDGIQWLPSTSDLARDAEGSLTGLNVLADGAFTDLPNTFWTGRVSGADCCDDWSSNAGVGGFGLTDGASFPLNGPTRPGSPCNSAARVVCLEQ